MALNPSATAPHRGAVCYTCAMREKEKEQFRKMVLDYYRAHGRHTLPWRATDDPYKILVSEVMLQQTQVERVIPYYTKWVKKWPTLRALARAPLSDALTEWQGLGYNRRAKFLHGAAGYLVLHYRGKVPQDAAELESVWGVGPYTARAVMTFAYNHDAVFIETNIRTAILHHFFKDSTEVSDEEIADVLKKVLPRGHAREWYSALMDYGAHLKRSGVNLNSKAKGYARQAPFIGSDRQVRGAIVRALSKKALTERTLFSVLDAGKEQAERALTGLQKDGLVRKQGRRFSLPE